MTKINSIAKICYELDKNMCEAICLHNSDNTWLHYPKEPFLLDDFVTKIIFIKDNLYAEADQVHNHWYHKKMSEGWAYGTKVDVDAKIHVYLVKFWDLPIFARNKEAIIVQTMKTLIAHL